MLICADRRSLEAVRSLAVRGARVMFIPSFGTHNELNAQMMPTRSLESEVFITFAHPGQSLIAEPKGRILLDATSPMQPFAECELDLDDVDRQWSRPGSSLRLRHPDVYRLDGSGCASPTTS